MIMCGAGAMFEWFTNMVHSVWCGWIIFMSRLLVHVLQCKFVEQARGFDGIL